MDYAQQVTIVCLATVALFGVAVLAAGVYCWLNRP